MMHSFPLILRNSFFFENINKDEIKVFLTSK